MTEQITLLDCTLRDGGYHNAWSFTPQLINEYLAAMSAAQVDVVEIGFRFAHNKSFRGPCAFSTDHFLSTLEIPASLTVGVMVNGADLITDSPLDDVLTRLFPSHATMSPVSLVRLACHMGEVNQVIPASRWLTDRGYRVGLNLMQIADRSATEVIEFANRATEWPIEVLYFADSMGGMTPEDTARAIGWLRTNWTGPIGVHTHDNLGLALSNSIRAQQEGATWLDGTVTGMGRGPGNARTEELVIELETSRCKAVNYAPLMTLIQTHFGHLKQLHKWGTNPYYYLSGKHGIHPTYIQEMLADSRYEAADILAVIDYLRSTGGKSFNPSTLDLARHFFTGDLRGSWRPDSKFANKDILILGSGSGTRDHRQAVEDFISDTNPIVIALNTNTDISPNLIGYRIACHPVRLLADAEQYSRSSQPLITPASMLPETIRERLSSHSLLDFGLSIRRDTFDFQTHACTTPTPLVLGYALAVAASGRASRILLAGFDGYPAGDRRNDETSYVFTQFRAHSEVPILSVTPSIHPVETASIYAMPLRTQ